MKQVENKPIHHEENEEKKRYFPLYLIIGYIFGVTLIINLHSYSFDWQQWMNQFMAGFFLVFSAFKFFDLGGFAKGYATYDWLARRCYNYGLVYPFLELILGILYLGNWFPKLTAFATIMIMGFSSLGVIDSLLKKQNIRCACLGTILNVPLSRITLVEDLAMVILACFVLIF